MPPNKSASALAASPKKTGFKMQHPFSNRKVLSGVTKGADKKIVEARVNVNSQILLHGIQKTIKHLGNRPISIVAKNSVKKGLRLKPSQGRVAKNSKTRKEVSKALNNEIAKLVSSGTSAKPSEVKAKRSFAPVKVLINTEILKKATLSSIRAKALKSPSKVTKKTSPTKAAPPKLAAMTESKPAKSAKAASSPKTDSGRPKRKAKGKKDYSDE